MTKFLLLPFLIYEILLNYFLKIKNVAFLIAFKLYNNYYITQLIQRKVYIYIESIIFIF
jgi:hypothetical protein